jgi:8-oxo-dGDP phosphatase
VTDKPEWLIPHGPPWSRRAERLVYENPWIRVTEHDAVAPTGRPALYGVVGFKNHAIAVLPLHADGKVTLVGQHRFALADYSWEIPEGGGLLNEDPLAAAKRELEEETGLVAGQWQEVLRAQLSNSVTDERAFGYLATELSDGAGEQHADETEAIAIARIPFREALEAALAGHLQDVLTVAMLLRAYHMAREGSLPPALAQAMLR